jgi:hypothetical protein
VRVDLNRRAATRGLSCGKTCRHYLCLWYQAGIRQRLHAVLLAELNGADQNDWQRAIIDASFVETPGGSRTPAPTPRIEASRAASITC